MAVLLACPQISVMAQEKRFKEIKVVKESEMIQVPVDSLWCILQNPDLSRWSTLLDSTTFSGPEKFEGVPWSNRVSVVNSKGHHESHEELIGYNPGVSLHFASRLLPKFIISNDTHWKAIDKGGNRSMIEVTTIMRMKPFMGLFLSGALKKAIVKNGEGVCHDIKIYAETGEVSEAKQKRKKELERQHYVRKYGRKYKDIELYFESSVINVSADSLWSILRKFDQVGNWTATLKHSSGRGEAQFEGATCSERVCETHIKGYETAVERLTMFNDETRELAYELTEGAPKFLLMASNHWKVVEIGPNQSQLHMYVSNHLTRLMGFLAAKKMTNLASEQINIVMNDLKVYAETGHVSEKKRAQVN